MRSRLLSQTVVAVPLRDSEMNERYLEVQTLAGRNLPEPAAPSCSIWSMPSGRGLNPSALHGLPNVQRLFLINVMCAS